LRYNSGPHGIHFNIPAARKQVSVLGDGTAFESAFPYCARSLILLIKMLAITLTYLLHEKGEIIVVIYGFQKKVNVVCHEDKAVDFTRVTFFCHHDSI